MNNRGLIGLVVVVLILVVVGFFWFIGEIGEDDAGECIKVRTSCCPCNMGGSEKCVLASEVEGYEENLSECSENVVCAGVYACEIESCEYVDGGCVER
jgi:hypothetical protein